MFSKCTIAASLLLVSVLAPGIQAEPGDDGATTVWGANFLFVKNVLSFGTNPCTTGQGGEVKEITDCGTGTVSNRGVGRFDVSSWNADGTGFGGRMLTVWVERVDGVGNGFAIKLCPDKQDDGFCTNEPASEVAYSDEVSLDGGCSKDEKDCGDPRTVSLTHCVPRNDDGVWGKVILLVGHGVDAFPVEDNESLSVLVSEGHYEAHLDNGSFVASC